MIVDMNKKYIYRNGEPARILCVDRYKNAEYSNAFKVITLAQNGNLYTHNADGQYIGDNTLDLIEVWQPADKEPAWAWDDSIIPARLAFGFYDAHNSCLYSSNGLRGGREYDNYRTVEHIEQWMLDKQKELED